MLRWLYRSWFLLALIAEIALGLAWPEVFVPATAWLEPRAVVLAALFLMAWTLPSRSLAAEIARPAAALWALALSYAALPALAWLAGHALPHADLHVGALISVAGPCTLASAVLWTRLAGGNEATALLVTVFSTASSWLITTAWLTATTGTIIALDPVGMMLDLLIYLVLPVAVGQLCRAVPPLLSVASRYRLGLGVVSQVLILAILLRAAAQVGGHLREGTATVSLGLILLGAAYCMGLHLAAVAAGWYTSGWLGFDRPRRVAVTFACSQKTLPVALLIFNDYFADQFPLAIVSILFYHAGQLLLDTAIARRLRA
jgi:sodium/bile acid cotransporter 7